jgi:predicted metal-dependent enzyme (double-stranded beta helix superfamily)
MRLIYKPFGVTAGVLAGLLAGVIFKEAWKLATNEQDTPDAKDQHRSWVEVLSAAAVRGAVFGVVKAAVDRAGASGYARITGVWPGNTEAPSKR